MHHAEASDVMLSYISKIIFSCSPNTFLILGGGHKVPNLLVIYETLHIL